MKTLFKQLKAIAKFGLPGSKQLRHTNTLPLPLRWLVLKYLGLATVIALSIFCAETALAAVTITRTSSPIFYMDDEKTPLTGMYTSYQITNTGGALNDVWVKTDLPAFGTAGRTVTRAQYEDGLVQLGPMAAGETKTAFFYVYTPQVMAGQNSSLPISESHNVIVYNTRPDLPTATQLGSSSFSFTEIQDTIDANANKVNNVTLSSGAQLGGDITVTVTGDTGTIGSPPAQSFSPATFANWPADTFELVNSSVTYSTGSFNNQLSFTSDTTTSYTATYVFRIRNTTTTSTSLSPVGEIASGTQIKHTDASNFGSLTPIPPISNNLALSKSVSSTQLSTGGTVTYTLRLTNAGTTSVVVQDIVDTLPSTPAVATYITNTAKYNNVAIADPNISGSKLTWVGSFSVPPGGTRDLTYQVNIPNTQGTYTNSAIAHIGSAQIDTTLDTSDNAPATANVSVGIPASLTVTKNTSTPNVTVGGTANYTITVSNAAGSGTATNVNISDALPSGFTYASTGTPTLNGGATRTSTTNPTAGATNPSWGTFTIPAGGSVSVPFTVNVGSGVSAGTYDNPATVNYTNPSGTTGIASYVSSSSTQENVTVVTPTYSISGKVWDDANNSANNTFTNINSTGEVGTNAGGLNAILVNASTNVVIATTPVAADGTYSFSNVTGNQSNVTIRLSTTAGTVGSAAPATLLPTNWTNTSPLTTAAFNITTSNITGKDFGIEQLPDTNNVTAASQTNPGGTTRVQVPALSGTDPEDGTLGTGKTFNIVTLPTNGTLYYNGTAVTAGQNITLYDPTKLTIDPNDGALTVSFTYAAQDAAGKLDPTPATVSMPFSATYSISGKVWDDADNSANNTFTNINTGTETGTNAGGLNAILINASTNVVIATTPVAADGTYSFSNVTGNQSNVTIRLSTTAGTVGSAAPATLLPTNWTNTSPLTTAAFNITTSNITGKDFGIEQLPDTNNVTAASQTNPGGTTRVQVPALSGTDPEDGTLGTGKTFNIVTLPTNGTLYYNGTAVTAGQNITLYDPTKLTIDPNDGALTVSFTYAAQDAAGKLDPTPATVSMPFSATYSISGKVWDDADNSANNTFTNINTGTETGTNAGGLNAILINASTNVVIATTPVAADGTYSFSNVTGNQSNVTIRLSTTAGTVGSAAPATLLPTNWTNTSPLTTAAFNITTSNITGKDFGIEQLPNTNNVTAASQTNPGGTTRVQVPALSGTDPEDGTLGTGKTFNIVTLPTNGTLYYNGTAVTAGQNITLYDPTKLTIDPNDGALTVSFTYAAQDAAGKLDPTPATVSMPFSASAYLLLVKRITAINGDRTKNPNDNTALNLFVDDITSTRKDDDNNSMWKSNYLQGAIDAGKVKPGDEIEYTVYFLNAGGANANNVRLCDRITANQDFKVGGYGTSKDVQLQLGTSTVLDLTSTNDTSDRTQFISAGGAVPSNCYLKATNDNGTLVIDVTGNANTGVPNLTTLPGSTAQATPNDSYGFFRFITKVKP